VSHPDAPAREFSLEDERTAATALACITLRRGIRYEKQLRPVQIAMGRLEELGLATMNGDGQCNLTDAGRELAREFLRGLRASMKAIATRTRAA
jgi:hypothetical protein